MEQDTKICPVCGVAGLWDKCPKCGFEQRRYADGGLLVQRYEMKRVAEHKQWYEDFQQRQVAVVSGDTGEEENRQNEIFLILNNTKSLAYPIQICRLAIGWNSFGRALRFPTESDVSEQVKAHFRLGDRNSGFDPYHFLIGCFYKFGRFDFRIEVIGLNASLQVKGNVIRSGTSIQICAGEHFWLNDSMEVWITTGIEPKTI